MVVTLAIETSCDETSAAVVLDGRKVLSNIVSSQIAIHAPFGGVVPEIASRQHVRAIWPVVQHALQVAGVDRAEVDFVAATHGPGLAGALLVGVNFARGFALGLGVPFVPVNHLEGHIHSVWLTRDDPMPAPPPLPLLSLVVSGGHTLLVVMTEPGKYRVVGSTLDDAAGEAFDKVARLLGLPYPGGPAIQAAAAGGEDSVSLPRAWLRGTYDFSFSGLKTAVLHTAYTAVTGRGGDHHRTTPMPHIDIAAGLQPDQVGAIARAFQDSVVDVLTTKTARAARDLNVASVALVGGVAANTALQQALREAIDRPLFLCPPEFATDNAAMIAAAAFWAPAADSAADIQPSLALVSSAVD